MGDSIIHLMSEVAENEAPAWFWRIAAVVFAGALVWIGKRHLDKIDTMLGRLEKSFEELLMMTKVHESEIENIKEDIRELKSAKSRRGQ